MSKVLPPPDESPLVAGGRLYPGVHFHEGMQDELLVSLSEDCAKLLAKRGPSGYRWDGHPDWDERYAKIRQQLNMRAVEVSAQADKNLADAPEAEVVKNLYDAWRLSKGHWGVVSKPHKRFGDGLARSKGGVWYGCLIVAD